LAENTTQDHPLEGFLKSYLMFIGRLFASFLSIFVKNQI